MCVLEPVDRPAGAPPWYLYISDPVRAAVELGLMYSARPLRRALPAGDGHPVLVLPGLLAGDTSTWPLRRILRDLGYRAYGWRLGLNIGPTAKAVAGMADLLDELQTRHDTAVSLIGWSLGGIFARSLARENPSAVRRVITLGSPFRLADESHARAYRLFNRLSHLHIERSGLPVDMETEPLPVPATAIYSRHDGMVAWQTCRDLPSARTENIAVLCSHLGYGHHAGVVWAIADRLAQPLGTWTPFHPPAMLRPLFPRPDDPHERYVNADSPMCGSPA